MFAPIILDYYSKTYPHINSYMKISYNNGISWTTIRNGNNYDSGWIELPWSSGSHVVKLKYLKISGIWVTVSLNVEVVRDISRRFYDSDGNSLFLWSYGSQSLDKPVVMIEGFDPSNANYPELYYNLSKNLITETQYNENDFLILNFADG